MSASADTGRAWTFGDRIDTDVLAPGALMKLAPEALAQHCLKAVSPQFAQEVQAGDFIVAGRSFGIGSSREQAAVSLRILGVRAVLAKSFARIFYRNALNLGLPALFFEQADEIADGDRLALDLRAGTLTNVTSGQTYTVSPIPDHLLGIIEAGGLAPYLKRKAERGA